MTCWENETCSDSKCADFTLGNSVSRVCFQVLNTSIATYFRSGNTFSLKKKTTKTTKTNCN